MFLSGISTRKVEEVLEPLWGPQALSASTVSTIAKVLDREVIRFHNRPLEDAYSFLILDGVYLKAKSPVSVQRRCILVAYGIRTNGLRELIDFRMSPSGESQSAWEAFLLGLVHRGLEGRALKLAVVDGNKGLWNALDYAWSGLPRQRCWAHKLRNVANRLPRKVQRLCTGEARAIYAASSYRQAKDAFKHWKRIWNPIAPEAVACLEQDLESLLVVYQVAPKPFWVKLRTTNAIERLFREVRRRTRPMSCFQNTASVERIIFAIFHRQNNLWKEKPLEITQKS
jgi:transposase-like protein